MAEKDYYKVLGISREASPDEIKKAFRQLARKYHPDMNPNDRQSEEKFKEINEAFQVLGNPGKKSQYDKYGSRSFSEDDLAGFREFRFDFDDLFSDLGFSDIFSMFNGKGNNRPFDYHEGAADIRYDLEITLEEAYSGTKKTIEVPVHNLCSKCRGLGAESAHLRQCKSCHGTGKLRTSHRTGFAQFVSMSLCTHCNGAGRIIDKPCEDCRGRGKIEKLQRTELNIPKGIDSNNCFRLIGKGEPGLNSESGDLYVVIHVMDHDRLKRDGNDLFIDCNISLLTAIFGGKIEVRGIDKKITVNVPAATQSHTILRIRSNGMPDSESGVKGDLFINLKVDIPVVSSDKEKSIRKLLG